MVFVLIHLVKLFMNQANPNVLSEAIHDGKKFELTIIIINNRTKNQFFL